LVLNFSSCLRMLQNVEAPPPSRYRHLDALTGGAQPVVRRFVS